MTILVFISIAAIFYAISFAVANFGKRLISNAGALSTVFAFAGFASQTTALGLRAVDVGGLPISTSYELLEFIVWAFVVIQLATSGYFKTGLVGIFSMLPAAVLTALPLGCPMFAAAMQDAAKSAPMSLAAIHGVIAAISYAFMAFGAIASAMYLTQEHHLRMKSPVGIANMLPSLQTLERLMTVSLGTALFTMTISALLGAIATAQTQITPLMLLKLATAAVVLMMQGMLFISTAAKFVAAKSLARYEIALIAVSLLLLIPIELRTVFFQ